MADLIGTQLGNYKIIDILGQGGMAIVYRAQQLNINREVAIKVIKSDTPDLAEFTQRFQLEAQTVAALSHPHILKIFEFGSTDDGLIYLVMELLGGGSLSNLIRRQRLAVPAMLRILEQVAGALDYAHTRQIIHRDLKPQNVLLDESQNAFLTDFGIAKLLNANSGVTQTGAVLGTPGYMAPEVWRGEAVDARADIYAFGVMIYEILTGQLPFSADTPYNIMYKHLHELPRPVGLIRPELPGEVNNIVDRVLAKYRDRRFDTAMATVEALRAALTVDPQQRYFGAQGGIASTGNTAPMTPSEPFLPASAQDGETLTPAGLEPAIYTPGSLGDVTLTPPEIQISSQQIRDQERRALAQVDSELRRRTPKDAIRPRIINPLPGSAGDRFRDRVRQQADIVEYLSGATPLVSIYGRAGVGKTALATRVLDNMARLKGENAIGGIVMLSTTNTGISVERIFADFLQLADPETRDVIERVQSEPAMPIAEKTVRFIEALGKTRYILFLDNLEALQDPETGTLQDSELREFIETAIAQPGGLRIVVTSREPIPIPRALKDLEKRVPLEAGLPVEDAVDLLRVLDEDGTAGLRNAPANRLAALAERIGGYPRALEAAVGLFLENPLLSIDDLIEDAALIRGEITVGIVQQALAQLPPAARRVMEALALYRRPVTAVGLEYLLAPHLDTANLRDLLARLLRGHFASFNKATQTFAIHPIDRDACYANIPVGTADDWAATAAIATQDAAVLSAAKPIYSRFALHYRAAQYFARARKPVEDWLRYDDIQNVIGEIENRILAQDYDVAADTLALIDREYLLRWGFYRLVLDLHLQLEGRVKDPARRIRQLRFLGLAYFQFRRNAEAIAHYRASLVEAEAVADPIGRYAALNALAVAYQDMGQLRDAVQAGEQALEAARAADQREHEGMILHNLAIIYGHLGETQRADAVDRQALSIAEAEDDEEGEGLIKAHLAELFADLGMYPEAIAEAEGAYRIGVDLGSPEIASLGAYVQAISHLFSGDLPGAEAAIERARQQDYLANAHNVLAVAGIIALRREQKSPATAAFGGVLTTQSKAEIEALDLRDAAALAQSGLLLLGESSEVDTAEHAAERARLTTPAAGLVARSRRLFEALAANDSGGQLERIRAAWFGAEKLPAE